MYIVSVQKLGDVSMFQGIPIFHYLGARSSRRQVLAFSFVDTLLGLSGPAMCLCFTLVPQRTAKLTEGGDWAGTGGTGGTGKWWGRSTP